MIDNLIAQGGKTAFDLLKILDSKDQMSAASTNARDAMEAFNPEQIMKFLGMVMKIVGLISG
jgi:hypothetical protein